MPTPYSNDQIQNLHPIYLPVRVANLNSLSIEDELNTQRFSSTLIIVWGGSGYIDINEVRQKVVTGNVLACSGTSNIRLKPQLELHGVWIEYISLNQGNPDSSPLNDSIPLKQCSPSIVPLAGELYRAWVEPQKNSPFAVQYLFMKLLEELYLETSKKTQLPASWLERVMQHIDNHYKEDLTRAEIARLANVSPEHFSRAFHKATGLTFNAYVTLLRIRKAQQRLLTGASNLTSLALEVGYGEGTYLSRKFKQVVGLSPTAYYKKNKRIVALNYNHTSSLLALEITPHLGAYSAWMESMDSVPIHQKLRLGSDTSLFYNSVASVYPDVIISYRMAEENKSLLPLAPVIELPFMQMSWREQFVLIAEVVNRRQRGEEWLKHYDALCLNANKKLNLRIGARGTAVVWEIGPRSAYCFNSSYGRGCQVLYNDLGFQPPASIVEKGIVGSGYLEIPIEDISTYPADHIFITGIPSNPEGRQRIQQLFNTEHWLQLNAVRYKQVYILNQPEMFYGFDPISSLAQLQVLLRVLTS